MLQIETIDHGEVSVGEHIDFEIPHEPRGGHPEVVSHHHDGLHMLAIDLPQRRHEFGILLSLPCEKPLLKLVEDEQDLFSVG